MGRDQLALEVLCTETGGGEYPGNCSFKYGGAAFGGSGPRSVGPLGGEESQGKGPTGKKHG